MLPSFHCHLWLTGAVFSCNGDRKTEIALTATFVVEMNEQHHTSSLAETGGSLTAFYVLQNLNYNTWMYSIYSDNRVKLKCNCLENEILLSKKWL